MICLNCWLPPYIRPTSGPNKEICLNLETSSVLWPPISSLFLGMNNIIECNTSYVASLSMPSLWPQQGDLSRSRSLFCPVASLNTPYLWPQQGDLSQSGNFFCSVASYLFPHSGPNKEICLNLETSSYL